jgi:hypothetical protein
MKADEIRIPDCVGPRPEYFMSEKTGGVHVACADLPGPIPARRMAVSWVRRDKPDGSALLFARGYCLN